MPDFHGYGYNSWQTPGSWGGSGSARSRMGMFHAPGGVAQSRIGVFHGGGSGSVGQFGASHQGSGGLASPMQRFVGGAQSAFNLPDRALEPMGGIDWGKGTQAIGNALKSGTRRSQPSRARQGGFQDSAGERYIGDVTHQPVGALGVGNQSALGRAYPGAIETTATRGALASGARVMPSGPRPAGPAPTPFALPAQAGSAAPLGPARRRGRAQSFGQLQFGGT